MFAWLQAQTSEEMADERCWRDPAQRNLLGHLKPGAEPDGLAVRLRRLPPRQVGLPAGAPAFPRRRGLQSAAEQLRALGEASGGRAEWTKWLGYMWDRTRVTIEPRELPLRRGRGKMPAPFCLPTGEVKPDGICRDAGGRSGGSRRHLGLGVRTLRQSSLGTLAARPAVSMPAEDSRCSKVVDGRPVPPTGTEPLELFLRLATVMAILLACSSRVTGTQWRKRVSRVEAGPEQEAGKIRTYMLPAPAR